MPNIGAMFAPHLKTIAPSTGSVSHPLMKLQSVLIQEDSQLLTTPMDPMLISLLIIKADCRIFPLSSIMPWSRRELFQHPCCPPSNIFKIWVVELSESSCVDVTKIQSNFHKIAPFLPNMPESNQLRTSLSIHSSVFD